MKRKSSLFRYIFHYFFILSLTLVGILTTSTLFYRTFHYTYDAILENNMRKNQVDIQQTALNITTDTTLETIADTLLSRGYIGNKLLFMFQGKLYNYDKKLVPGTYQIENHMSNTTILDTLTTPPDATVADLRLTIPEGFTLEQIANRVHDLGIVTKEEFLEAANQKSYPFSFLEHIPSEVPRPLEGYLFPDTYFISPDASAETIILKMLQRFEDVISPYTTYLHQSPYTLHHYITIASIIENEARLAEERPIISGVIFNRLENGMKLQMCSTVQYALGTRKKSLSLTDLTIDSPYNTYLYDHLPIGPICSPSSDAIKASFLPDEHDYFFFVLKDSTTGSHRFSQTAEQHALNKEKYQQSHDQNFLD